MKKYFCALAAALCLSGTVSATPAMLPSVVSRTSMTRDEELSGQIFRTKDIVGCEFEFQVNEGGLTVTLIKGDAKGAEHLEIPGHVSGLGSDFQVRSVGAFAFKDYGGKKTPLKGVKHMMIAEGVALTGQNCFEGAPDLEDVILPASLEKIGYGAFGSCPKLHKVRVLSGSKMRIIGSFAFENCESLEVFEIPQDVEDIGDAPWRGCRSMEAVTMSAENYNFVLEEGVLYNGWGNKLIQYPAGKKDKAYNIIYGAEIIGNSAFYGNPYIESVWFPASLDMIEHIAFFDCKSLSTVTFSNNIRFIGNKAFAGCPDLKNITLYGDPKYTCEPGDSYNTFDDKTKVTVKKDLPEIKLTASPGGILTSVRDYVAAMPSFQTEEIDSNQKYGFPEEFGKGKVTLYGNAGPKKDVLRVLENIPADMIAYENIDDKGRITRFYFDRDKKTPRVLFFKGGINGNDLVVALFEVADPAKTEEWLRSLKYRN